MYTFDTGKLNESVTYIEPKQPPPPSVRELNLSDDPTVYFENYALGNNEAGTECQSPGLAITNDHQACALICLDRPPCNAFSGYVVDGKYLNTGSTASPWK